MHSNTCLHPNITCPSNNIHIREVAWEALAVLAATDLTRDGDLRSRPEYWVGQLEYLLGAVLIATEQEVS